MKKMAVSAMIITLISILVLSFTISSKGDYVKIPQYTHSLTKAICNSENFCQDYEIFCEKEEVIKMSPITGAAIQFSETWQDQRDEEMRSKFC